MSIIVHNWNGFSISQRISDSYVCLTDMAKACDRNVYDYLRLEDTKAWIAHLSTVTGIPVSGLLEVRRGNFTTEIQGTWAHLDIAIGFAWWVSHQFRYWAINVLKLAIPSVSVESGDPEMDSIFESLGVNRTEVVQKIKAEPVQNSLFDENLNLRTVAEIMKDSGVHPVVVLNFAMPIGMQVAKTYAVRFGKPPQHASWNNSKVYPNHFHGDVMNIACAYLKRKGVYI